MITHNLTTEFWVISDTHLIADSLHDHGQAFARMQATSQGKDLYYQEIALSAFVQMAQEKKPAAIIITGDVTFNGELISAEKLRDIFKPLTDTQLLMLPGNHDIYDGWARKFRGDKQYHTEQISPDNWRQIFQSSYDCAVSQDPNSLAYSVQLNPQYLLLMLDSNYYEQCESQRAPYTQGGIQATEFKWIKQQLAWAKAQNLRPIMFMHHNLYAHHPLIYKSYVLDNAAQLRELCEQYDVKLLFSGHLHNQNILGPQGTTPTTEILTSSFCTDEQAYGVTEVSPEGINYHRESFEMLPYLTDSERKNPDLRHFRDYLKQIHLSALSQDILQHEFKDSKVDPDLIKSISQMVAQLNYNYFTGKNHLDSQQVAELKASEEYQTLIAKNPQYQIFLASLYDTSAHSNLKLKLNYAD